MISRIKLFVSQMCTECSTLAHNKILSMAQFAKTTSLEALDGLLQLKNLKDIDMGKAF